MKRIALIAVLSLISLLARGTTLPPIELGELFKEADIVASVEVVSGRTLGSGEASCGAKYSAVVLDGFKGVSPGTTIEFGNFLGYEIGGRYILFLVRPGAAHAPVTSTNSMQLSALSEIKRRCGTRLLRHTVMHSGAGALKVDWVGQLNYEDGVAIPTKYVVLPPSLPTKPAKITERNEFSDEVWVALPEFIGLLKGLGR